MAKLNPAPHVINEDTDLRIAHITFAYDNAKILELLTKRGELIIQGKYTKIKEINKEIQHKLTWEKEELTRPVAAFISFEKQEGYERALKLWPKPKKNDPMNNSNTFLKEQIKIQAAPEPSNILWENIHVISKVKNRRYCAVTLIIAFLLMGMFVLFTLLDVISVRNLMRYPSSTDCNAIKS